MTGGILLAIAILGGPASAGSNLPQEDPPACQGADLDTANSALADARVILDQAIAALRSADPQLVEKGSRWLGLRSSAESEAVRDLLVRARAFAGGVTFQCALATPWDDGYFAYVRPDNSFAIILGPDFVSAPSTGFSSKPGTIVHEITHFYLTGAADDPKIYGRTAARNLAVTDPSAAQRNAENIEYYVEAVAYGL
jgi:peptidyl-Lys metalloendopeptidase